MFWRQRSSQWVCVLLVSLGTSLTVFGQENDHNPIEFVGAEIAAGTVGALLGSIYGPQLFPRGVLGYIAGSAVLSSIGVVGVGLTSGVRGNIVLSALGAGIGASVGFLTLWSRWQNSPGNLFFDWFDLGLWGVAVLFTGVLATIGFNVGATMELKTISVYRDKLELVSAQLRW